jgi:hypothetical protein
MEPGGGMLAPQRAWDIISYYDKLAKPWAVSKQHLIQTYNFNPP